MALMALTMTLFLVGIGPLPSSAAGGAMLELTEKDCGKTQVIPQGSRFRLTLPEQGATGFIWEPTDLEGTGLEVLEVKTAPRGAKELVGGPVAKTWLLQAGRAGQTSLTLLYRRPWEKEVPPARSCVIFLDIR